MSDRILVIHLGRTGMSFVRHFKRCGCDVEVVDERDKPPESGVLAVEFPDVKLRKVESYADLREDMRKSDLVAVSSGIAPNRLPADIEAVGDLGCFLDAYRARWPNEERRPQLVAITGTNGKSTVASLVTGMIDAAGDSAEAVGNIGVPLLDAMHRWERDAWPRFIIAELSSFQLARNQRDLKADVACLLNVSDDHLDWHGDHRAYVESKGRVFKGAAFGAYDVTDPVCRELAEIAEVTVGFGGAGSDAERWNLDEEKLSHSSLRDLSISTVRLKDAGIMPRSACAALTVAGCASGWRNGEAHASWLGRAMGLPHRLETVSTVAGVKYVNDSKATNEAASIMALDAVPGPCVLVAGGVDKGQDFSRLGKKAAGKIAAVVMLGQGCEQLERAIRDAHVPSLRASDMEEAVSLASSEAARLGTHTVLLSPACGSFDMFDDFEQRGMAFRSAVGRLAEKECARA